jgi:hypothetical protein
MIKLNVKKSLFGLLLTVSLFSAFGCAALVVGGAAVGAGSGTYMYMNGELKTDYPYSFDKVWVACEKTVADMRGIAVEPIKEIGQGTISAKINNESVKFIIKYKDKNLTTVGIRVGIVGDQTSSKLIHDKVMDNITRESAELR